MEGFGGCQYAGAEMGVERSTEGAEEATRLNPRVDLSSAEETAIDVGVARQLDEGNESSPAATSRRVVRAEMVCSWYASTNRYHTLLTVCDACKSNGRAA